MTRADSFRPKDSRPFGDCRSNAIWIPNFFKQKPVRFDAERARFSSPEYEFRLGKSTSHLRPFHYFRAYLQFKLSDQVTKAFQID